MSIFQTICAQPVYGSCTKIFCQKSIPEKLISFHRMVLQKITQQEYRILNLDECNLDELFAQLSITFLGAASAYSIKDGLLSSADRKRIDLFLKNYSGPHALYFFTSDPVYEKDALLVDQRITKDLFHELMLLAQHSVGASTFIERLFSVRPAYTFDESLTLMHYGNFLGARSDIFFEDWLNRILVDDLSLFTLSQYFFARRKPLFIKEWARLKNRYPREFWLAFFSEQLWQAIVYHTYASRNKSSEAKRYAYRLPFSYFQKDWKNYPVSALINAHNFLYEVDYGLKNGYATYGLEIFIHTAWV